jgi:hypothetical protein
LLSDRKDPTIGETMLTGMKGGRKQWVEESISKQKIQFLKAYIVNSILCIENFSEYSGSKSLFHLKSELHSIQYSFETC